ncbi:MAG: hypothetical protein WD025_00655 [Bacteriovoracaceae bacterium]
MKALWTFKSLIPLSGVSLLFALLMAAGCAGSYQGQNRIQKDKVIVAGGVIKDKKWDDRLVFKRSSFFKGANLHYDILIAKVAEESPFMAWMESSKNAAKKCNKFFIVLLYKNQNARQLSHSVVREQLRGPNMSLINATDFKRNFREHYLFNEYNFKGHSLQGLCDMSMGERSELKVFIPGFEQTNIL